MKQPTRKTSILALVGSVGHNPTQVSCTHAEERAAALKESFEGWLDSVAPTLLQSAAVERREVSKPFRQSLSSIEHIRVNRATVREGTAHRPWPPDVVLSFLAADVITRNRKH
jgi:hypothetical protein